MAYNYFESLSNEDKCRSKCLLTAIMGLLTAKRDQQTQASDRAEEQNNNKEKLLPSLLPDKNSV